MYFCQDASLWEKIDGFVPVESWMEAFELSNLSSVGGFDHTVASKEWTH